MTTRENEYVNQLKPSDNQMIVSMSYEEVARTAAFGPYTELVMAWYNNRLQSLANALTDELVQEGVTLPLISEDK
jgi:predicted transcriptional regulator